MHAKWMKQTMVILAVLLAVFLTTSAAYGQTIYVPDDFATIQAALDAADDLYTIIVRDGVYTGPGNRDLDFKGKALTLRSENGPENCIVDCDGSGRGFVFGGGETSASILDGFTVTNGNTWYEEGGAIYCHDSSPAITNCIVRNNRARSSDYGHGGAGIYIAGGSAPIISNCIIADNVVELKTSGGGIYCGTDTSATITNCTISGNSTSQKGGGIYCDRRSTVTISDCLISENFEAYYGGGVYLSNEATGIISNCTISGNSAESHGGGISAGGSETIITGCIIIGNAAGRDSGGLNVGGGAAVENCIIANNTAEENGGGLGVYSWTPVDNCIIKGNVAENGGGIYFEDSAPTTTSCTIAGNFAVDAGGGIYCEHAAPILTNCILWGNNASLGPEIALPSHLGEPSSLAISYSDVQGGRTAVYVQPGCALIWGAGNLNEDPLFAKPGYWYDEEWFDGDYHLTYNSPCKDTATDAGVDSDIDGDARPSGMGFDMGADEFVYIPNNCPVLDSPTMAPNPGNTRTIYRFTAHYSDEDGDAPSLANVVIDGVPHAMSLLSGSASNGTYYYDTRLSAGMRKYHFSFHDGAGCLEQLPADGEFLTPEVGGITRYVPEDYSTIQAALDDCLSGDTIIVGDGVYTGPGNKNLDFGGKAITLRSGNGPEHCVLDCEGNGRGFYFHNREALETIIVDGFSIVNGYSSGILLENYGGAILCCGGSSPTIENCIIQHNYAGSGGGIAAFDKASPSLINCTIAGNSAHSLGGGIYGDLDQDAGLSRIVDCKITGNQATAGGGICYDYGGIAITNCDITGNTASAEGGALITRCSDSVISNCRIESNSAGTNGGAVYLSSYSSSVADCKFSRNSAGQDGGAVFAIGAELTFADCFFGGNSAAQNGGAIRLTDSLLVSVFENCLLTNNAAGQEGGAISLYDSVKAMLSNCTLSANSASAGGALSGAASTLFIKNSILSGNTAQEGAEIALLNYAFATICYSDVDGGMPAVLVDEDSWLESGDGNMAANPLFVSGPLGNYYLSQRTAGQVISSPCVDAGSNMAAYLELHLHTTHAGNSRDGNVVDMGYHYPITNYATMVEINLLFPRNGRPVFSTPVFAWSTEGRTGKGAFVVDLALSMYGPAIISQKCQDTYWDLPRSLWDMIPSGRFVYWRVRGADLDARPLSIIYSDEIWWFYKP